MDSYHFLGNTCISKLSGIRLNDFSAQCILTLCQKCVVCLQRVMNARQFGLKLIANVTYGYTSAGFSGRMPMAEIADSIVQVSSQQHGAVVYNPDSALQHAASSN